TGWKKELLDILVEIPDQRIVPVVVLLLAGLTAFAQSPSAQGWPPDVAAAYQQQTTLLMQGLGMTPDDADAAEKMLASSPDNLDVRLKLVGYYGGGRGGSNDRGEQGPSLVDHPPPSAGWGLHPPPTPPFP